MKCNAICHCFQFANYMHFMHMLKRCCFEIFCKSVLWLMVNLNGFIPLFRHSFGMNLNLNLDIWISFQDGYSSNFSSQHVIDILVMIPWWSAHFTTASPHDALRLQSQALVPALFSHYLLRAHCQDDRDLPIILQTFWKLDNAPRSRRVLGRPPPPSFLLRLINFIVIKE